MVMYAGQVVELGDTRAVFDAPAHPYSKGLLDAFPSIRGEKKRLTGIPGAPPNLSKPPSGCRFHPRCPVAMDRCRADEPELYTVGAAQARCLLHEPATVSVEVES
jgi:peptide/nickel transport system ATP-binding protein